MFKRVTAWPAIVLLLAVPLFSGCERSDPKPVRIQSQLEGRTMGTIYHIKMINSPVDKATIQTEIDKRLALLNAQMSTYQSDSELSLFNQSDSLAPYPVSDGTAHVVQEALRLAEMTGGALDVTVGPLVNLWGFGPDGRPVKQPDEKTLAAVRARTGYQKLSLENNMLQKSQADLYVDLSSIAKGYGVDLVADYLKSLNINDFMVEIGGELRLSGLNQKGVEWRIAVEKPNPDGQSGVQQVVAVGDNAMATSGDYRNYFELEGQRITHTIDPETGYPVTNTLASATVVHPSSMTADGLATALLVMGTDDALEFASKHGLAVYLVSKTEHGFEVSYTPEFKPFLQ